jgi:hypothetical protein
MSLRMANGRIKLRRCLEVLLVFHASMLWNAGVCWLYVDRMIGHNNQKSALLSMILCERTRKRVSSCDRSLGGQIRGPQAHLVLGVLPIWVTGTGVHTG